MEKDEEEDEVTEAVLFWDYNIAASSFIVRFRFQTCVGTGRKWQDRLCQLRLVTLQTVDQ